MTVPKKRWQLQGHRKFLIVGSTSNDFETWTLFLTSSWCVEIVVLTCHLALLLMWVLTIFQLCWQHDLFLKCTFSSVVFRQQGCSMFFSDEKHENSRFCLLGHSQQFEKDSLFVLSQHFSLTLCFPPTSCGRFYFWICFPLMSSFSKCQQHTVWSSRTSFHQAIVFALLAKSQSDRSSVSITTVSLHKLWGVNMDRITC